MDEAAIAETLFDELETQCRSSSTVISTQKRNSQVLNSPMGAVLSSGESMPTKRHSSVDYSWLTPNNNLLQSTQEVYHLPDIVKMELAELLRNVLAEDCTLIINQFRRHLRTQTKSSSPENIIALFRKTISEHLDQKPKHRASVNPVNEMNHTTSKNNQKNLSGIGAFVRNNRINPKNPSDDEQECIAELTEISITSSSNDGAENKSRSNSQA